MSNLANKLSITRDHFCNDVRKRTFEIEQEDGENPHVRMRFRGPRSRSDDHYDKYLRQYFKSGQYSSIEDCVAHLNEISLSAYIEVVDWVAKTLMSADYHYRYEKEY